MNNLKYHVIWEQIHAPRRAAFPNALESCQSLWGVWVLSPGSRHTLPLGLGMRVRVSVRISGKDG